MNRRGVVYTSQAAKDSDVNALDARLADLTADMQRTRERIEMLGAKRVRLIADSVRTRDELRRAQEGKVLA